MDEAYESDGNACSRLSRTPACWLFTLAAFLCALDLSGQLPHHHIGGDEATALELCEAAAAIDAPSELELRDVRVTQGELAQDGLDSVDPYVFFTVHVPGWGTVKNQTSTKINDRQPDWSRDVIQLKQLGEKPASLKMFVTVFDSNAGYRLGHFELGLKSLAHEGTTRHKLDGLDDVYLEFGYTARWLSRGPLELRNILVSGGTLSRPGTWDEPPDPYIHFSVVDREGRVGSARETSVARGDAQPRWDDVVTLTALGDRPAELALKVTLHDKGVGSSSNDLGSVTLDMADLAARGHKRERLGGLTALMGWGLGWDGYFAGWYRGEWIDDVLRMAGWLGFGWLRCLATWFNLLVGGDVYIEFDYKAGWLSARQASSCEVRPKDHRRVILCQLAYDAFEKKLSARRDRLPAIKHLVADIRDRLRYGASAFRKRGIGPIDALAGERRWMTSPQMQVPSSVDVLEVMATPSDGWFNSPSGTAEVVFLHALASCIVMVFLVAAEVACTSVYACCSRVGALWKKPDCSARTCRCQQCMRLQMLREMSNEN